MIGALITIAVIVWIDQKTKEYARENFKMKQEYDFFTFYLVKNKGAFRGLFKEKPKLLLGLQAFGTVFTLILTLVFGFRNRDKWLTLGLALISAGAIGNLIDRIRDGEVTDFVAVKWTKNLYYNMADFSIFIGAFVAVLRSK